MSTVARKRQLHDWQKQWRKASHADKEIYLRNLRFRRHMRILGALVYEANKPIYEAMAKVGEIMSHKS